MKLNEENVQRMADSMAAAGPFIRQRAAELGQRLGVMFETIARLRDTEKENQR
jgi:hypothetical protein